jgi:hypothetical protein
MTEPKTKTPTPEERITQLEEQLARTQAENAQITEVSAQVSTRNAALEEAHRELEARRAAAALEPENEQVTIAMELQEAKNTNFRISRQEMFKVFLPMDPRIKSEVQTEMVQINGAARYVVVRGEDQIIPESIYMVLVESGMVRPQRPADFSHCPRVSVKPGKSAALIGG